LYAFVGNNTLTRIDPLGLAWFDDLANWAQEQHRLFYEPVLEGSGRGSHWFAEGALLTGSELFAGLLSYPQTISRLGTGTGTYAGNPTLENLAGVFEDISITADVLAGGLAPLPSFKPKHCPIKSRSRSSSNPSNVKIITKYESGNDIYISFDTSEGPVGFSAKVIENGNQLHFNDVAIYPEGAEVAPIGVAQVLQMRELLLREAQSRGFTSIRITGQRFSGANHGKNVDVIYQTFEQQ